MNVFFTLLIGIIPFACSSRVQLLRVGGDRLLSGKPEDRVTIFGSDSQIDFRELFERERSMYDLSLSLPYVPSDPTTTKPIPTAKPIAVIMATPSPSPPPSSIPSDSPSSSDASDDENFDVNSNGSTPSAAVKSTLIAVFAGAALIGVAAFMARKFRRKNNFGKASRVGGHIGDVFMFERDAY